MSAVWLLRLYPARWRQRYGPEFAELLSRQRATPGLVIDIVAGAIDARLRPQSIPAGTHIQGDGHMTTSLLKRCAMGGPAVSQRDQLIGASILLGGCIIGSLLFIAASARFDDNPFVEAFGMMVFPFSMALSMPCTYLKHHSRSAKASIVIGMLAVLSLISYLAALI